MCEYTDTHARMHVHVEVRGQLQVLVLGSCSHQLWRPLIGQGSYRLFPPQCWAFLQVFCGFIDYAMALALTIILYVTLTFTPRHYNLTERS